MKYEKKYQVKLKMKSAMIINDGDENSSGIIKKGDKFIIPATTLRGVVKENFKKITNQICLNETDRDKLCNCNVCKIFGGSGYNPSKIYFDDLINSKEQMIINRTSIAINRYSKKTIDGALVNRQAITEGEFIGDIKVYFNDDTIKLYKELFTSILMIESIGFAKSRGYGFVSVEVNSIG